MDKKLLEIWKGILKINDEIIKTRDEITTTCFIINKDYSIKIMALIWKNTEEKNFMKYFIKKLIANQEILGYGFISDTYATNMITKEVQEIVMRNFYTPKETISSFVIHKGNEIIKEWKPDKNMKFSDSWNLWDNPKVSEEEQNKYEKEYAKFRNENPELYGEK